MTTFNEEGWQDVTPDNTPVRFELYERTPAGKIEWLMSQVALLIAQQNSDERVRIHMVDTIEQLARRVECLEIANHNTAEWANGVEQGIASLSRSVAEIAKHVGLKPAPLPETPEAL